MRISIIITMGIIVTALLSSPLIVLDSSGHRDGCHRWHSCPSDNGSYVCGDLGYDDECGGNEEEDEEDEDSSRKSSNDNEHNNNNNDDNDNDYSSNSDNNKNGNNDETITLNRKNSVSSDLCSGNANCFTGVISKVIDGDTVEVDNQVTIRLALINTPERGEQGYQEAKDFLSLICGVGEKALVDEDDGQKGGSYGRMIGLVYCGDDNLLSNQLLIENDYAQILEEYCERSEFSDLDWAQKNGCY
ncbi:thermonuclease family protein [Candidatus Nitrosocosmicus franklandus]|nr:thermonuclease family protein [Candidatus Nitrosocosmicus franklandus]